MIALQALSEYAKITEDRETNLEISADNLNKNAAVRKPVKLTDADKNVEVMWPIVSDLIRSTL